MNATIVYDITNNDVSVICPFCDYSNMLQYQDYVDRPMIWCDCDARSIFDLTINELEQWLDEAQTRESKEHIVQYPLLYIERVISDELSKWVVTNEIPSDSDIKLLIDNIDKSKDSRTFSKFKVNEINQVNEIDYETRFKISVPCNSYDIETPSVPYPENFKLYHDGVFVYCKCRDKNDKIVYCKYWGD